MEISQEDFMAMYNCLTSQVALARSSQAPLSQVPLTQVPLTQVPTQAFPAQAQAPDVVNVATSHSEVVNNDNKENVAGGGSGANCGASSKATGSKERGKLWERTETLSLIAAYTKVDADQRNACNKGKSAHVSAAAKWHKVKAEFLQLEPNSTRDENSIQYKWESLMKAFKSIADYNKGTGVKPYTDLSYEEKKFFKLPCLDCDILIALRDTVGQYHKIKAPFSVKVDQVEANPVDPLDGTVEHATGTPTTGKRRKTGGDAMIKLLAKQGERAAEADEKLATGLISVLGALVDKLAAPAAPAATPVVSAAPVVVEGPDDMGLIQSIVYRTASPLGATHDTEKCVVIMSLCLLVFKRSTCHCL